MEIRCRACDNIMDYYESYWSKRRNKYEDLCKNCLLYVRWSIYGNKPRALVQEEELDIEEIFDTSETYEEDC
jgi:hypothetical protein